MAIQEYEKFQDDPKLRDLAERREKFLRDVNSSRMTAIRRARAEGIAVGEARGIAVGEARGIAVGEARGKAEGKAEGELKQAILTLLQLVEWNLGKPSASLRSRLQEMTDLTEINRLYEFAVRKANSLSEFEKEIP